MIARIVQRKRPAPHPPGLLAEFAAKKLAEAPDGHCPKCGGRPLLLGTTFAEDAQKQCMDCDHKFETGEVAK